MTRIVIEPPASLDVEEAARWYENQHAGLGVEPVGCVIHNAPFPSFHRDEYDCAQATPKIQAMVYTI